MWSAAGKKKIMHSTISRWLNLGNTDNNNIFTLLAVVVAHMRNVFLGVRTSFQSLFTRRFVFHCREYSKVSMRENSDRPASDIIKYIKRIIHLREKKKKKRSHFERNLSPGGL